MAVNQKTEIEVEISHQTLVDEKWLLIIN